MKRILSLLALTALGACSSGDPETDARWARAAAVFGAGVSNYGAAIASQPAFTPSVYCYPVGRGTLCN